MVRSEVKHQYSNIVSKIILCGSTLAMLMRTKIALPYDELTFGSDASDAAFHYLILYHVFDSVFGPIT